MEYRKIYHRETVHRENMELLVEGPVSPENLQQMKMHETLDAFRPPEEQHKALVEISELPEGRIIVSRLDNMIVGYVTFHAPDPLERWSEGNMEDLVELGAVEVAEPFRKMGLGKKMIRLSFAGAQMDNLIIYTTEYYWHWDLDNSGLNVWQYREMMENLMKSVGMVWYATDDPEICSHPANCLMVKVGPEVPQSSVEQFDAIRFQRRFMY